ncbi:MAG TPA: hypothetical protein VEA79_06650, partial [Phenylobacterium sp.]|nr:hypothetical protein [Phenylobacterium sp.]
MAFDAEIATAAAQESAPVTFTATPESARTLFDLATASGAPIAWEIAARALAKLDELRRKATGGGHMPQAQAYEPAARPAPEPCEPIRPAQPSEPISPPTVEAEAPAPADQAAEPSEPVRTAHAKAAPKAKRADPAEDLGAALPNVPRAKACVGAFHVVWSDGSETRVSGVVYHAQKAATRWAAA